MPSAQNQTVLYPPPTRSAVLDSKGFIGIPLRQWLFTVQYIAPLITVDTSGGAAVIALPAAGNLANGQTNPKPELI